MQHDEYRAALTLGEFVALVDEYLTPSMAALGYHRIDGYVNDQSGSRSLNTTTGGETSVEPFLWFDFGYEAGSDEVKRLVGGEDPESEDEWWLHYEPLTGRLELAHWEPVAKGRVDWDVWSDDGPCTVAEVRRRLSTLGRAVLAFVQEHGGHPITP